MERLLIDISHKHHMPPKNKPQLKPEEIGLIQAWIRSGGSFTLPLSALPPDDTLHVLARALYGDASREAIAEKYDFPPADVSNVAPLNNAYRALPLHAKGTPAREETF